MSALIEESKAAEEPAGLLAVTTAVVEHAAAATTAAESAAAVAAPLKPVKRPLPPPPTATPTMPQCKVLFDFVGEDPGVLDIVEDELLNVLDQSDDVVSPDFEPTQPTDATKHTYCPSKFTDLTNPTDPANYTNSVNVYVCGCFLKVVARATRSHGRGWLDPLKLRRGADGDCSHMRLMVIAGSREGRVYMADPGVWPKWGV